MGRRETRASQARWLRSYCQIYCQKRGGEGTPADGKLQVFSNLLISICVYVGSTKIAERFLDAAATPRRSGAKRRTSGRPRSRAIPPFSAT